MTPERWRHVRELFDKALQEDEGTRQAFLDRACADDLPLRSEVASLLRAHEHPATLLEQPALRLTPPTELDDRDRLTDDAVRQIGPYELCRPLGSGGMCTVYLATRADHVYDREVAIKLLKRGLETEELVRRFCTERRILADLDHPNITKLLDGGVTSDGRPYLVMEFIDGTPIDVYCEEHRLSIDARLRLFRKVCAAVQFAHRNLVVHRDLKPANILVTALGEPKLLDFGIAKLLASDGSSSELTQTGLQPMTPTYASPEQLRGGSITTASDAYSLGLLLYKLLTSRLPHCPQIAQRMEAILRDREPVRPSVAVLRQEEVREPDGSTRLRLAPQLVSECRRTQPRQLSRRLAGDLDAIVLKALRSDPAQRYPSVEQLAEDLERFEERLPVRARRYTLRYHFGKFVRRHKIGVALAAGFLAFLAGVAAVLAWMAFRIAHERDQARIEQDKAQQVSTFMVDLFEVVDPGEARGNTITVREVLDRGLESISQQLREQPEVQAAMLDAIGQVYRNLGLYDQAAPILEEALSLRRRSLGSEHPDTLSSMSQFADVTRDLGDFATATTRFVEVLEIQERVLGNDHPEVAETLGRLVWLLVQNGEFNRAEAHARRALKIVRQEFGEEHRAVVFALVDLASVLHARGNWDDAEVEYRKVVSLGRKLFRDDDPLLLPGLKHFASFLADKGNIQEAEKTYHEILEVERKVFGPEHPKVAFTLNHLGALKRALGDLEAAERFAREGLEMRKKLLGEDHPAVGPSTGTLAEIKRLRGEIEEAQDLFGKSIEIVRKEFQPGYPGLAYPLLGLARCLMARSDFEAALPYLREALAIRRRALASGNELVGVTARELGRCLIALGQLQEAEDLLLEEHKAATQDTNRQEQARETLELLVELYRAWNRPEEERAYLELLPGG